MAVDLLMKRDCSAVANNSSLEMHSVKSARSQTIMHSSRRLVHTKSPHPGHQARDADHY
jgi:hypothetical protein